MSARKLLRGVAAGAIGARLLTHQPVASAATSNGSGSAATTSTSGSIAGTQRATRLDAGGGAVAYLVESHELPLVDVAICFRSGSAFDPENKLGLARVVGRMLRRGAAGWSSEQIEESTDRYGAELSIDVSSSSLTVHAQVIRRNLEPFMKLVADLLSKPTFPEDELARLQRETLAEIIEARDSDRSLAGRFFRKALFGAHPYGRGGAGTTKTIPTITRDDVVAFHATHLRRGSVVIGIAGDVTADDAKSLILPVVDALPSGTAPADPIVDPTVPKGRHLVFVDKPARTQTQILIGGLGTRADDPDHVALHVANTVFGGTFTARLMKEVRSKRGWSYGAYSRMPIDRKREAFSMWTFPAATDAVACIGLELELLEKLVHDGISDDELSFAKSYLSESYAFDVDTPFKRVRQAIDEDLYGLPSDYHTGYVSHVLAVTKDAANASLKARVSLDDLAIVVVGTAADLKDGIAKAIPRLASTEVVPFDQE